MKQRQLTSILVLAFTFIFFSNAISKSYIITSPEYSVRKATLIIVAEVQDIQYVESSQGISFGEITLKVEDRIVGNSFDIIKIRRPFVTPDLQFLDSEWIPSYKMGQRFIITLLENPDNERYTTLGLYNGKFIIDNDIIQNTTITIDQFKQYTHDIRNNRIEKFPDVLSRMADQQGQKSQKISNETPNISDHDCGLGEHFLDGEFNVWDFTWDPTYLPLTMQYNSSGAPPGTPTSGTIANLANLAYDMWDNNLSFFTAANASTFTTSASQVDNNVSVILWEDLEVFGPLAFAAPYPNTETKINNCNVDGPESNTGVDIVFNSNDHIDWYFNATAPTTRTMDEVDFVEVLAHEIGHGLGLAHNEENNNSIMFQGYDVRTSAIRSTTGGDQAGNIYQHTSTGLSGTLTHSLVLSASKSSYTIGSDLTLPTGEQILIIPGSDMTFSFTNNDVEIVADDFSAGGSDITFNGNGNTGLGVLTSNGTFTVDELTFDDGSFSMDGNLELRENTLVKNNADLTILDNSDVTFGTISTNPTLTINSGSKFIVEEGVTFNMWESSDIYSNGRVTMLGTSGNEIVFDKVPTYGTWDGIWLEDSGTSGSSFEHVIVKNAATGLRIYNTWNIDIAGSIFDNNDDDGLQLEDVSSVEIWGSEFSYNTTGVGLIDSNVDFSVETEEGNNIIYNSEHGLFVDKNSNIDFGKESFQANGLIDHNYIGVNIRDSNLLLGLDNGIDDPAGGYICIDNNFRDIISDTSDIVAHINYWGTDGSPDYYLEIGGGGSSFSYLPRLFSAPPQCSGSFKYTSTSPIAGSISSFGSSDKPNIPSPASGKERTGFHKMLEEVGQLRKEGDPQGDNRTQALAYLSDVIEGNDPDLIRKARILRLGDLSFLGQYDEVINEANSLLESNLPQDDEADVNLRLMRAYLKGSGDTEKALQAYERASTLGAKQQTLRMFAMHFKQHGINIEVEPEQKSGNDSTSVTYTLNNHPNPFNPTSVITYTLPEDTDVRLDVFNIAGQRVAVLTDQHMSAGTHQVQFDATNLSSGVYIYRLTAGSFVQTKSMTLIK